jgi:hypothetical protein
LAEFIGKTKARTTRIIISDQIKRFEHVRRISFFDDASAANNAFPLRGTDTENGFITISLTATENAA